MSLLTIDQLRIRIGLTNTDSSRDADLLACYEIAKQMVETYLDRWLFKNTYTEQFFETRTALLKAWPLDAINLVDGNAPPADLKMDKGKGMVFNVNWDDVAVEYIGGFADADLPMPVTTAINAVFDNCWTSIPGFGLTRAAAAAVGTVKKFSINGMSVEYVTDAASSTGTGSSSGDYGLIPTIMRGFLDHYRRETVIGAG